jgi:hypothetical protein
LQTQMQQLQTQNARLHLQYKQQQQQQQQTPTSSQPPALLVSSPPAALSFGLSPCKEEPPPTPHATQSPSQTHLPLTSPGKRPLTPYVSTPNPSPAKRQASAAKKCLQPSHELRQNLHGSHVQYPPQFQQQDKIIPAPLIESPQHPNTNMHFQPPCLIPQQQYMQHTPQQPGNFLTVEDVEKPKQNLSSYMSPDALP